MVRSGSYVFYYSCFYERYIRKDKIQYVSRLINRFPRYPRKRYVAGIKLSCQVCAFIPPFNTGLKLRVPDIPVSSNQGVIWWCQVRNIIYNLVSAGLPINVQKGVTVNIKPKHVSRKNRSSLLRLNPAVFLNICHNPKPLVLLYPAVHWCIRFIARMVLCFYVWSGPGLLHLNHVNSFFPAHFQ